MTQQMRAHRVLTREEWRAAREQLLVRDKEHTRVGNEFARERRALPWVSVEKEYRVDTDDRVNACVFERVAHVVSD